MAKGQGSRILLLGMLGERESLGQPQERTQARGKISSGYVRREGKKAALSLLPSRFYVTWLCHVAMSRGCVSWLCHVALTWTGRRL